MNQTRYVIGRYEAEENILALWHPQPLVLNELNLIEEFFKEVNYWLESCPTKPYLLVNYANVNIAVDMTPEYSRQIKAYRPMVLNVFRYNISDDLQGSFTAMAIRMGNLKTSTSSNIYPDETSARQAIKQARQSARLDSSPSS